MMVGPCLALETPVHGGHGVLDVAVCAILERGPNKWIRRCRHVDGPGGLRIIRSRRRAGHVNERHFVYTVVSQQLQLSNQPPPLLNMGALPELVEEAGLDLSTDQKPGVRWPDDAAVACSLEVCEAQGQLGSVLRTRLHDPTAPLRAAKRVAQRSGDDVDVAINGAPEDFSPREKEAAPAPARQPNVSQQAMLVEQQPSFQGNGLAVLPAFGEVTHQGKLATLPAKSMRGAGPGIPAGWRALNAARQAQHVSGS